MMAIKYYLLLIQINFFFFELKIKANIIIKKLYFK